MTDPTTSPPCLTVLYDGGCPLCRREIDHYRQLQPLDTALPVCFTDISDTAKPVPSGFDRAQLLARFHVQRQDGEVLNGAPAFLALWSVLPGWRWLALLGRVPGFTWLMERTYLLFLRFRPRLQRWASKLDTTD